MAWIAYVGAALAAYGQYEQGQAASQSAAMQAREKEFEALQQEQLAKAEVASSQRAALNEERQSKLVQSAVVARAQGGAGDPTVVNVLSDLAAEGSYRASVALYEGQARARQARMGAAAARYEALGYNIAGRDAAQAGTIGAASTIFTAGARSYMSGGGSRSGSLYGKYGSMPASQYEPYSPGTRLPNMGGYN